MKRRSRNLSIFNMSALDVLATAMGTFVLLVVMLMPYYRQSFDANAEIEDVRVAVEGREAETQTLDAAAAAAADEAATLRAEVATLSALTAAAQAEANALRADATANTEAGEATTAQTAEVAAIVERRIIRELDIVFVVDTTASMAPALRDLSLSLVGIVRVLERLVPSLRVGFVAYRDHDVPGWLTLQLPLTPTASRPPSSGKPPMMPGQPSRITSKGTRKRPKTKSSTIRTKSTPPTSSTCTRKKGLKSSSPLPISMLPS